MKRSDLRKELIRVVHTYRCANHISFNDALEAAASTLGYENQAQPPNPRGKSLLTASEALQAMRKNKPWWKRLKPGGAL